MKFKIVYQENQKIKSIILESNSYETLQKMDIFPSNIIKMKELKEVKFDLFVFRNSKKDVYEFFTQLDIMLGANLSFSQSIDLLLDSKQEKKIEQIIKVIQHSLSSSISIDKALFQYKTYLGETSLLFLKLGFENGNIKESIHSLVEILEEDIKSSEKLSEVMRYPIILIISLFVSIGMIFLYVLPNFEFIFSLLKDEIPFSTSLLLSIKKSIDSYWLLLLIMLGVTIFCIGTLVNKYRYIFHKILLLNIPIFSKMIQAYYFYRLFLSMSIIVKSKYQFQVAISNSKNIVNNLYVQKMMDQVVQSIKNGTSISEAFGRVDLFDNLTMKLLNTADNTNNYEYILLDITAQYKKRFHKSLKTFSSTIEPMLIFIISLVVLWLILAIMLPIWNLGAVIN